MHESRIKIMIPVLICLVLLAVGVFGLMLTEGMSFFDACWLTIISLSTTGFGDIVPRTAAGRTFLMLLLVVGVGVLAYGHQRHR